jgi:hypothetical protein
MPVFFSGPALTEILKLLPFLIPVLLIQYGLLIFALVQLVKNETAYLPKWGWALIIIFINIIGSIIFLILGKKKYKENEEDSNTDD